MSDKVNDYTKIELGRATRMWKGKVTERIARCRKCGKNGSRSVTFPDAATDWRGKPYVHVTHQDKLAGLGGIRFRHEIEGCTVTLDKTNVDDHLNVPERKQYDAFVAAIRERLALYAD